MRYAAQRDGREKPSRAWPLGIGKKIVRDQQMTVWLKFTFQFQLIGFQIIYPQGSVIHPSCYRTHSHWLQATFIHIRLI